MSYNIKTCCLIVLSVLSITNAFAQQKYEKESRLPPADVPVAAMQFVDSLHLTRKIKWYLEEGLQKKSIEAKFHFNEKKHSIEFDTLGNIQDAEIRIKWKTIAQPIRNNIERQLDSKFDRHKIRKIQIQYSGSYPALLSLLTNGKSQQIFQTHYELIVKGKQKKNGTKLYEMTFDDQGNLLKTLEIIFKNSDNLEY